MSDIDRPDHGTPENMRLLITGTNGFLGTNTAAAASRAGYIVTGADLPGSLAAGERVRAAMGCEGLKVRETDLASVDAWREALQQTAADAILHLAGVTQRGAGSEIWDANVSGNVVATAAMIRAIVELPEKSRPVVVFPGSQLEYGLAPMPWTEESRCEPTTAYAATKLAATELLLAAERTGICKASVLRIPILYGPGQAPSMFVPELTFTALAGEPFKMTEGRQRRRFIYSGDAAGLLIELARRLIDGAEVPALLNSPASPPEAMRDIARRIAGILGDDVRLEIGAIPMRGGELTDCWPDDSLALSRDLACATSLEQGLTQTVSWYRDNPWFREGAGA